MKEISSEGDPEDLDLADPMKQDIDHLRLRVDERSRLDSSSDRHSVTRFGTQRTEDLAPFRLIRIQEKSNMKQQNQRKALTSSPLSNENEDSHQAENLISNNRIAPPQSFWLPGYGISRFIVFSLIPYLLGPLASVRPYRYHGRDGYLIHNTVTLTLSQIEDLQTLSREWEMRQAERLLRKSSDLAYYDDVFINKPIPLGKVWEV